MAKKKKRTLIRWGRILWPLVIVIGVTGWYVSPATSITSVRVVGAKAEDQARVKQILAQAKDVPFPKLNGANFESLVMDLPGVETARLSRTPFGKATLTVEYIVPVARVSNGRTFLLGADGSVFSDRGEPDLPVVRLNPAIHLGPMGLANPFDAKTIIDILGRLPAILPDGDWTVEVPAVNRFVVMAKGCEIELGDRSELAEKFQVLQGQIRLNPDILATSASIILTQPKRPAVRPRPAPKKNPADLANGTQYPPN